MRTCMMCTSLYVKANGDIPCWDDVGESHILRRFALSASDQAAEPLFHSPELVHIRESHRAGMIPFPGLCERCAVFGHGELPVISKPTAMQVLHLEASYLCHLSCPQCIPAKLRHSLSAPPYNMSTAMLRSLMERLVGEGVETVRIIHFEGRGDPLVNPDLGELILLSKQYFPNAISMVTTHASYPYKPWLTTCGLDILRASIDGAFADSYEKYRVGGNLDTALCFLRSLRNECRRSATEMKIVWKYILFEWNDSDEEMRHATMLAAELECDLQFVLTHTPGRSQRFANHARLHQHLREIGLTAAVEITYQLKPATSGAVIDGTAAEYVEGVLKAALKCAQANDTKGAVEQLVRALTHDPGLSSIGDHGEATIRVYLNQILSKARLPLTLSWLAAISREWRDGETSAILLQRYLDLAPDAPDREHVRQDLAAQLRQSGSAQRRAKSWKVVYKHAVSFIRRCLPLGLLRRGAG
jgi:molybdenum cofactor biosynthesis enzyme MoaA